ncbi:MAG: protease inhibitor I42 family protein [Phascolarctobacterium sp.]|uniref:protease inhibitor I42 family protein n=1 Tax=Phascolarctobacterium sp. TaxID=2049039 RepID=UPI0026DA8765|nr:protease inhibitor I42 family protein [Phascolarctobacterium sp.]MDO4921156.1 protease inhibitor I42 family protein [Phascolarctobacterium sp.]
MKILLTTLLCLALCLPVFADQQTTVLRQEVSIGKAQAVLPYIDGSNSVDLEKKANGLILAAAQELSRQVGGGSIDYEVTLNRPSLISVLLTAKNGGVSAYRGLNLDLTTGEEFGVTDFFVNNDAVKNALHGYEDVLFSENGLLCSGGKYASYDALTVPYSQVLPSIRIGEAGRIMQVARLTAASSKKTLVMDKGGLIALKLDANPSTGYGWAMSCSSPNVQKVGSSFTIPRAEEERVGVPGTEIVFLAVQKPGTYNIKMEYKRPWEKLSLDSFSFTVVVQGA